ncbi:MAG: hypothetical protein M0020_05040 [Actinomycetota bacterium]|nr:hypothetical protein [Actinomycetota bacterium]
MPKTTTTLPRPRQPTVRRPPAERGLDLSSPSAAPGATVSARGYGCAPGSAVTVDLAGRLVGTATADAAGDFDAPVPLSNLAIGQYAVVAHCGPTLQATVAVVLVSRSNPATSTLVVLIFFVLLGLGVVWHQVGA